MAKDISVEIGFEGGNSTSVGIPEDAVAEFKSALQAGGEPWYTISCGDGSEFVLDKTKVVFVRVASGSRSIGFGV